MQSIFILKVNFVLTRSNFVVRCFNIKAHAFKFKDDFSPTVFPHINWGKVKVAAVIVQMHRWFAGFWIKFEKEEFRFRTNVKVGEPFCFHFIQDTHQIIPRIAHEWLTISCVNFADDPGYFSVFASPWKNHPG